MTDKISHIIRCEQIQPTDCSTPKRKSDAANEAGSGISGSDRQCRKSSTGVEKCVQAVVPIELDAYLPCIVTPLTSPSCEARLFEASYAAFPKWSMSP